MSFDFEKQYANEWGRLGFYYYFDHGRNCWRILGSQNGLLNFCNELDDYVKNPKHIAVSEHEHYGPDTYFKVVTWYSPIIKIDGIYGSLEDIQRLGNVIRDKLLLANISDEIVIDQEYSLKNECILILKVMDNEFDPSRENHLS